MTGQSEKNAPASNLRVNADRLWDSIHEIARIGPGVAGGNNRQTLTDEDGEARRLFAGWCEAAGMAVGVDAIGNMFATRPGTDPDAAAVFIGSHLDTQPTGGRYDGVLGVLAGLEAVRTLNDLGIRTRHPITVVNWTNEEGTRFAPSLLGSAVFTGALGLERANAITDAEGKTVGGELDRIGWRGPEEPGARPIHALFELHIEQGPLLEAEGKDIGVVTHGQGVRWLECTVTGMESHAGTTPMTLRRDAALGMARIIEAVNAIAMRHQPGAVGTVGNAVLHPNSTNVIAGKAIFAIDFRSHLLEKLDAMVSELRTEAERICAGMGLAFSCRLTTDFDPPAFDPGCVATVREAASRLGYSHMDIVSGAGHDACQINAVAPAAMIFCPCVGGLSHNEAEEISKEWASAGADVLMHAALQAAGMIE